MRSLKFNNIFHILALIKQRRNFRIINNISFLPVSLLLYHLKLIIFTHEFTYKKWNQTHCYKLQMQQLALPITL